MQILFPEQDVQRRIREMGREISAFYQGKPLTLLAIANGGLFFACDLSRAIETDHWFDSMAMSSYRSDRKSSAPQFHSRPKLEVRGRHLLIADDIFDTGETIEFCRRSFLDAGALSIRCAVLVSRDLPDRKISPEWAGFHCQDGYLIGCGMDSCENYRNLRCIGVLDQRSDHDQRKEAER